MKRFKIKSLGLKSMALFLIIALSSSTFDSAPDSKDTKDKKKIKIALLLDTSNSMDGLIEQAKSQLWQLVNELATAKCEGEIPNLEIALYEYGNDRLIASEGYIRQVTALTNDLDQISSDLFGLRTNGGSEFCGQVIQTAINQQEWSRSSGDLQIIFIAGNEPFTQGGVNYKTSCANAKEKNIIVNTIHCGSFDDGIRGMWKDGADRAGGQYMCIEQDRKTVFVSSPFDNAISSLNVQLNNTYISYGKQGAKRKANQSTQDSNAAGYSTANEVKRAVSKSSHFYKNSSWDLVDAAKEESFELEEVKDDELPKELRGKTTEEKEKYIAQKAKERAQIQKHILELNKKREKFVAEKSLDNAEEDMLDKVMIKALKEQASTKGYKFSK